MPGTSPAADAEAPAKSHPVYGKTIRIEFRDKAPREIGVAELQVMSGGVNIASLGDASMSSSWRGQSVAEKAVDGMVRGNMFQDWSVAMTDKQVQPYWELSFPKPARIDQIVFHNRQDAVSWHFSKMNGAWISVLDGDRKVVWEQQMTAAPELSQVFTMNAPVKAPQSGETLATPALPVPMVGAAWNADAPSAGAHALAFRGGRAEIVGGGVELLFGNATAPFRMPLELLLSDDKTPAKPMLENGRIVCTSGKTSRWSKAQAVITPAPGGDGVDLTLSVTWLENHWVTTKTGAKPIAEILLGNVETPAGAWLRGAWYVGRRYDHRLTRGFLGATGKRKLLAGGSPLEEATFISPGLGSRRIVFEMPTSAAFAKLSTEADGMTRLSLEPKLEQIGKTQEFVIHLRFPDRVADAETAAAKKISHPGFSQQEIFLLNAGESGAFSMGRGIRPNLLAAEFAYERDGKTVRGADLNWTESDLSREFAPAGEPETFARYTLRARNADVKVESVVRMKWSDISTQFLNCSFESEVKVEALRPGVSHFRIESQPQLYSRTTGWLAEGVSENPLSSTRIVTGTEGPRLEAVFSPEKTDEEANATYNPFYGVRLDVRPIHGVSSEVGTTGLAIGPRDSGKVGELAVGRSYTFGMRANQQIMNGYDCPINVLHPGRRSPYFTLPEPVALEVRVPAGSGALSVTATDGETKASLQDQVAISLKDANAGGEAIYTCTLNRKDPGVTALTFTLASPDGKAATTRGFEVVQIGDITKSMPAKDVPDEELLDLKLVDTIDCANEADAHPRHDFPGTSEIVDSPIGKCRRIGERNASMIWEIKIPDAGINQPHLIVAEYPDDEFRAMSLNVSDVAEEISDPLGANLANKLFRQGPGTGVQHGWPFPLTHKLQKMTLLWWPAHHTAYVGVSPTSNVPEWGPGSLGHAKVKRILIYRVKGEIPALKPAFEAAGRAIGYHSEGTDVQQVAFRSLAERNEGPGDNAPPPRRDPRYVSKYYNVWKHYIQYLNFSGQNLDASSVFRYEWSQYPGGINNSTMRYGYQDQQELLMRMGGANGVDSIMNIHNMGYISPARIAQEVASLNEQLADKPGTLEPTLFYIDRTGKRAAAGAVGGPPKLNFNTAPVQRELTWIVKDLARRFSGIPGVRGVGCLWGGWNMPSFSTEGFEEKQDQMLAVPYDDQSIAQFERESGVKIPVAGDDPKRYVKRYDWLMANAKEAWIDWRCGLIRSMAERMRQAAADHNLDFWFTRQGDKEPWLEHAALTGETSALANLKKLGFDPALYKNQKGLNASYVFFDSMDQRDPQGRDWIGDGVRAGFLQDPTTREQLSAGLNTSAYIFNPFRENRWPLKSTSFKPYRWQDFKIGDSGMKLSVNYAWPGGDFFAHDFVGLLAAGTPPATIMHTWLDCTIGMMPNQAMRRFALAFRTLPMCEFTTLTGNGLDRNVVIRKGTFEGKSYFFVINPTWSPMRVTLKFNGDNKVVNLVTGQETEVEDAQASLWRRLLAMVTGNDKTSLTLDLLPYDLKSFRLDMNGTLASAETIVPPEGATEVERRLAEYEALLGAWGDALPVDDADAKTVREEMAATRAKLAEKDFRGALGHSDGWRLRTALQRLLPLPGPQNAAPPVADDATELLLSFDTNPGTAPADESSRKRKVTGNAPTAAGVARKAADMSKGTFTADVPNVMTDGNSWTYECWISPTKPWSAKDLVILPLAAKGKHLNILWHPSSPTRNDVPVVRAIVDCGTPTMPFMLVAHTPWKPGQWYHLAMVYDKDAKNKNLRLYINGRLEDVVTTYEPVAEVKDAPETIKFGTGPYLLDDVRISSKARSLSELGYPEGWDSRSWSDRLRE